MSGAKYTILQTEAHATKVTVQENEDLKTADTRLVVLEDPNVAAFRQELSSTDAILCAAFKVTHDVLTQAKQLKIVARLGTGVDNIDIEAATEHGVVVTNVPDFATEDVAEHTIALILACAKHIPSLNNAVRADNWGIRSQIRLQTVDGKTLGLIGFGRIGRAVARYASALGMRVIAHDPFVEPEEMLIMGQAEPVESVEALLKRSDFVSLHAPLIVPTEHMISSNELSVMKKTAFLINCGRGALVDEAALVAAVNSGTIAGAGLDVLEQEPPSPDNPVLNCPGIIITPHCSAHTERALSVLRKTAIRSILQVFNAEWPDNVVNHEVKEKWLERSAGR